MVENKCKLTHKQCDKLEDLRISLWDKTFDIQKNSENIKSAIEEIQNLVTGTEQDKNNMLELNNMKNTADFLMGDKSGLPTELYTYHDKEFKKPYRTFGYFNNIIHSINDYCECNKK